MSAIEIAYTAGLYLVRGVLPLLAHGEGKLARGVRGRSGSLERIESWARTHRDRARPLVWFHAPSVGEGLQARAVMQALRVARADVQLAYTFFSPSAEPLARALAVDVADYLPLDLPRNAERLFDALAPDVVAFSKTEVWPNFTRVAGRCGAPVVLLSATLPPSSSRLRRPARALLGPAHASLACVAAISAEDAQRFGALGVPPSRTRVMGDARFDQVWQRAHGKSKTGTPVESLVDRERLTIVAGSTWPPDEDQLIAAFAKVTADPARFRLLLVPHEPTPSHLARVEKQLAEASLDSLRFEDPRVPERRPPVLVVDRVGILGDLYRLADIAYVGGGFGNAGLHSVLEPAAFGAPVLFGPHHRNAREAAELIAAGGARSVTDEVTLTAVLDRWLENDSARLAAGASARGYVERGLGAARRGADVITELLARRAPA